MGIAGSGVTPYPVFRQALDAGQLQRCWNIAGEMRLAGATVSLQDALRIVELLALADDDRYERAALKLFGRLAAERRVIDKASRDRALDALARLPERPEMIDRLRELVNGAS